MKLIIAGGIHVIRPPSVWSVVGEIGHSRPHTA